MGTISAHVPDELETELEAYLEAEHLDRNAAVRKLLAEGLERWRIRHALEELETGDVTLSRAAERADVSVWKLAERAEEQDVTWIGSEHVEEVLESL